MVTISKTTRLLFFLFIFLCLSSNFITLKNGHNWGEDFSQYIMHARNIVDGQPYISRIMLDNPVVYPPGFPLLLAPLILFFGINFIILKIWNVVFWFGITFLSFKMLKDEVDELTNWLFSCFLSCSAFFFIFKQNVISDVPFMFFTLLTLFMTDRFLKSSGDCQKNWQNALLLFLLMGFCLWLRSAGLVLIVVCAVYSIWIKKRADVFFLSLVALIFFYVVQRLWIGNNAGYFSSIASHLGAFITSSIMNCSVLFKSLWYFVFPPMNFFSHPIYLIIERMIGYGSIVLFGIVLFYLFTRIIRREIDLIEIFCLLYGVLVIFWSGFPHKSADFVRFVLPLIVPGFILLVRISKSFLHMCKTRLKPVFLQAGLGVLILVNIINIAAVFDFNDDVLFLEDNATMFAWIKNNLDPDEHYMMWPPRVAALMTGRLGTSFWLDANQPHADWQKRLDEFDIHYLVFHKYVDQPLMDSVAQDSSWFLSVWENDVFRIYRYTKK